MADMRVNVGNGVLEDIRLVNDAGDVIYVELTNKGRAYVYNRAEEFLGRINEETWSKILEDLHNSIREQIPMSGC